MGWGGAGEDTPLVNEATHSHMQVLIYNERTPHGKIISLKIERKKNTFQLEPRASRKKQKQMGLCSKQIMRPIPNHMPMWNILSMGTMLVTVSDGTRKGKIWALSRLHTADGD